MIGILYGVRNSLLIKFIRRGYKGIRGLIIFAIFINFVGKIISFAILRSIGRIWKDKAKVHKLRPTISIHLPMFYPPSMSYSLINSKGFKDKMKKKMFG